MTILDLVAGFVESSGKSPKDLVSLSSNEVYEVLRKWALSELRKGSYTAGKLYVLWNAVKNFLKFHGIEVKNKPPFKKTVKYLDKIPTKGLSQAIKWLMENLPNQTIPIEEVVKQAYEEEGLEEAAVETAIWRLTQQGRIYQPEPEK